MSNLTTLYMPPDLTLWQGRVDAQPHKYFYQIIKPLNNLNLNAIKKQAQFAILGFACDIGVKRNHDRAGKDGVARSYIEEKNKLTGEGGRLTT